VICDLNNRLLLNVFGFEEYLLERVIAVQLVQSARRDTMLDWARCALFTERSDCHGHEATGLDHAGHLCDTLLLELLFCDEFIFELDLFPNLWPFTLVGPFVDLVGFALDFIHLRDRVFQLS